MSTFPVVRVLVLLLVLLPLISAVLVPLCGRLARRVSLVIASTHLVLTGVVILAATETLSIRAAEEIRIRGDIEAQPFHPEFVPGDTGGRHGNEQRTSWTLFSLSAVPAKPGTPGPNIQFYLGIDGLNLWLVALASFMIIPVILVSWESITEKPGAFYGWLFLLQAGVVGAFLAFDVILFYIFFELTLIPAFFLIGRWGVGSGRRDAARKFFLYTLAGSLLTLIGVIGVVVTNPHPATGQLTFSLPDLMVNVQHHMHNAHQKALAGDPSDLAARHTTQFWLFVALMAGFMVKVPIWPFHTWLPSAYGEAPIGVTMLLSALMAKLGAFGILRLVLPLVPDAAIQYGLPVIGSLAAFGIVYAALCAFASKDMKMVIAYSSVSHLGFLVLGLFAFNREGLSGSVLHMVNHGLSTGALFAALGFLLERYRTTEMNRFGGLMGRFPGFAFLTFILVLASIGMPGLNNFVSEMMMLAGLFNARNPGVQGLGLAVVAALSIFMSAWYMLTMVQCVFFNPLKEPEPVTAVAAPDVTRREFVLLGTLVSLCLALGLFPQLLINTMKADVRVLSIVGDSARARVQGVPYVYEDEAPPPPLVSPGPPIGAPGPKGKGGGFKGKGGKGKNPLIGEEE
ncbi:MAG: NADH-quinone oxidoreductase subunit M [Planctomycetia bacterium]|nr:NADH-quinone oxidoreductase subunit M [Planctomycetia bacterium]